jgi:hypothetical protein
VSRVVTDVTIEKSQVSDFEWVFDICDVCDVCDALFTFERIDRLAWLDALRPMDPHD